MEDLLSYVADNFRMPKVSDVVRILSAVSLLKFGEVYSSYSLAYFLAS